MRLVPLLGLVPNIADLVGKPHLHADVDAGDSELQRVRVFQLGVETTGVLPTRLALRVGNYQLSTMSARLYDTDLVLWADEQARALRAASAVSNLPIDWENVAEEIESLGKSQGRELASRISTILIQLMKLDASPATEPRPGWQDTILTQRDEIERLLSDAPSLRTTIAAVIESELPRARKRVVASLAAYGETPRVDLRACKPVGIDYAAVAAAPSSSFAGRKPV